MLDGIVVINKKKGCTSHDVVNKAKKIFNEKVGHTGTLDPNATGVLPLLIGKGTKLSYYLIEHDKEYTSTLQLGIKTATADGEGEVLEKKEVPETILEEENIISVLESFLGKEKQIPPMYSAIKVNGKKLYEYARKNQQIEVEARDVEIYDIKLLEIDKKEKQIVFHVKCSKGTYIRSLCEEIANKLGTVGYMKELERTNVGRFKISNAVSIEDFELHKNEPSFMDEHFITIENFFKYKDLTSKESGKYDNEIQLNNKNMKLFFNGVKLEYFLPDGLYRIYDLNSKFIGIGLIKNNFLKREIIVANTITI